MSSANRKPAGGHHARRCLLTCGRSSATLLAMPKTLNAVLPGLLLAAATAAAQTRVQPILGFPEQGLDDPAAYQGYQTRFFRDTKGNVVQVYLDASAARVEVNLDDIAFGVAEEASLVTLIRRGVVETLLGEAENGLDACLGCGGCGSQQETGEDRV